MKKESVGRIFSNLIIFSVVCIIGALSFVNNLGFTQATSTQGVVYDGDKRVVCLVFMLVDEDVTDILEVLDAKGVKANFLVSGKYATNHPENLVKIVEKNHEIINHGYLNRDFSALGYASTRDDIKTAEKVILSACGYTTKLFMPPKGKFNDSTLVACAELGYKIVLYSKSAILNEEDKVEELLESVAMGDVVLLSPSEETIEVLPEILDGYFSRGLEITRLSSN